MFAAQNGRAATVEALSARMTADLRQSIMNITSDVEPFTPRWNAVTAILSRLGKIAQIEREDTTKHAGATLWEGSQQAVRLIVECGKLSVIMKLLADYSAVRKQLGTGIMAQAENYTAAFRFEEAVTSLLTTAWKFSEVVLLLDIGFVCGIMRSVLEVPWEDTGARTTSATTTQGGCGSASGIDTGSRGNKCPLWVLALRFISALASLSDGPYERAIVHELADGLLDQVLIALVERIGTTDNVDVDSGLDGLSRLVSCEEFTTAQLVRHLPASQQGVSAALEIPALLLIPRYTDAKWRRVLRPLHDFCNDAARGST